jgi:hypothetical protein
MSEVAVAAIESPTDWTAYCRRSMKTSPNARDPFGVEPRSRTPAIAIVAICWSRYRMNAKASGTDPVSPVSLWTNPAGRPTPAVSPARIADASRCASNTCAGAPPTGASTVGIPIPKRRMLVAWTRHVSCLRSHGPYADRSIDFPDHCAPSRSFAYHTSDDRGIGSLLLVSCWQETRPPCASVTIFTTDAGTRSASSTSRACPVLEVVAFLERVEPVHEMPLHREPQMLAPHHASAPRALRVGVFAEQRKSDVVGDQPRHLGAAAGGVDPPVRAPDGERVRGEDAADLRVVLHLRVHPHRLREPQVGDDLEHVGHESRRSRCRRRGRRSWWAQTPSTGLLKGG